MKKILLGAAALLWAVPALAQVQQSGTVTARHPAYWVTSGAIGDPGGATDSALSSLGVTNEGGAGLCVSSQRASAAGRQQLCLSAGTLTGATISLTNLGTAPSAPLSFVINGISYPFPGALSTITVGTTPVTGGTNGTCLYVNAGVVGNQTCNSTSITNLTGDGTANGPGSVPLTLATVNGNVGTFGSTTVVPLVTVNGKGLITAISNATILISANSQLTGPTLSGAITASSLTSVGTIGTGVWQGTIVAPTYGGTGINNGSNTLTLAAALTTTGAGAPTLAFPSLPFTYTFQGSSDTMVGRATTDTLTNKTLTTPTINGAALSGTLSGTPTLSGSNFVTNANMVQAAAATLIGNPTASLANQSAFTIQGLTNITTPNSTLDLLPIYNHTTGTIQYTNANELITAAGGGVTSIAGNAGAFTLTNGITNTVNAIGLTAARLTLPTTQILTSGSSATYTTPANALWIEVYACGAGGGGNGATTGSTGAINVGGVGGTTTFNSINAVGGGVAGAVSALNGVSPGGVGGTGGTGSATYRQPGNPGGAGIISSASSSPSVGGASYCGGGATSAASGASAGVSAAANSGGGGSGSYNGTSTNVIAGSGGGGEMFYLLIGSPAGTYTYTVGTGGTAGVGTTNGGVGGSGKIIVIEHYGS
jgi:hypothetical protein